MTETGRAEFSVCAFQSEEIYFYECQHVPAEEAVRTFKRMTENVAARVGITQRVILTDGGDCINMEWQFGKGIIYPEGMNK